MAAIQQSLDQIVAGAPRRVVDAIQNAAQQSGIDFGYLLQQAKAESSFDPEACAKTSSAQGLFQFIESTWMTMVNTYGEKYGIDCNAARGDLLNLRNDADLASHMAAELAGDNQRVLDKNWGGDVGATELYFAHFLGAGKASSFLNARDADGSAPAAALFPKAAAANEGVFYDRTSGRARSLDEVYAFFDRKFIDTENAIAPIEPDIAVADASSPLLQNDDFDISSLPEVNPAEIFTKNSNHQPSDFFKSLQAKRSDHFTAPSALSSYQSYLMNPIDLIMLTQLDTPFQ